MCPEQRLALRQWCLFLGAAALLLGAAGAAGAAGASAQFRPHANSPPVEIILMPGMVDSRDVDETGDPLGLPRVRDYIISSVSRHALTDTVRDGSGRQREVSIGRIENREYRWDPKGRRPAGSVQSIVQHYKNQLALMGADVLTHGSDRLSAQYQRAEAVVMVTLEVQGDARAYTLSTGGPGAQDGTSVLLPSRPAPHHTAMPSATAAMGSTAPSNTADQRALSVTGFHMPPAPMLYPPRGTRGMTVLLAGPGVDRASAVRFGTSDAEIVARETARLRVRVPLIAQDVVPVFVMYGNDSEPLATRFQILDTAPADAAVPTIAPCDSRPDQAPAGINEIHPLTVRPGQKLKLMGRRVNNATHVTFTVARHEVDPVRTGLPEDLIGIDFGASGKPRTAPRWLDTLAANMGRSYGVAPAAPGECDTRNPSGYAMIRHTGDREAEVCVPALALSGPLGLWTASGDAQDICETSEIAVHIVR